MFKMFSNLRAKRSCSEKCKACSLGVKVTTTKKIFGIKETDRDRKREMILLDIESLELKTEETI